MMRSCSKCHKTQCIDAFAPGGEGEHTERRRANFNAATAEEKEQMATKTCMNCRNINDKCNNKRQTECHDYLSYIQATTPCIDCGQVGTRDLIAFCAKDKDSNAIPMSKLSHWVHRDRGVEAMKANLKNFEARCLCCKSIHDAKGHKLSQFGEWWKAQQMDIGKCAECERIVTDNTHAAFQFAHYTATQKRSRYGDMYSVKEGYNKNELSFDEAIHIATNEVIPVCRLLCKNCHKLETKSRNRGGAASKAQPPSVSVTLELNSKRNWVEVELKLKLG